MMRQRLILACGLCAVWLVCSCGESQETPSRYGRALGGKVEGAPLPWVAADPGILRDQKTYQAPPVPGAPAVRAAAAGGANKQPSEAVGALVKALNEGFPDEALKLYRQADVAALEGRLEPIFKTFNMLGTLKNALNDKLGPAKTEKLPWFDLASLTIEPKQQDAERATAAPNVAAMLFGPVKNTPAMGLIVEGGTWKFALDSPLTAAEVDAIMEFHGKLQAAIEKITNWVDATETVDEAALLAAVAQAIKGEAVELGGETPTASAPTTQPEKPEEGPGRAIIKP